MPVEPVDRPEDPEATKIVTAVNASSAAQVPAAPRAGRWHDLFGWFFGHEPTATAAAEPVGQGKATPQDTSALPPSRTSSGSAAPGAPIHDASADAAGGQPDGAAHAADESRAAAPITAIGTAGVPQNVVTGLQPDGPRANAAFEGGSGS